MRLQSVSLTRVIKYAFIKDNNTKSFADKLFYPKKGIGEISKVLSKDLDIRLNEEITGMVCFNNRIEKTIVNGSKEFACRNIISTMPITKLIEFFNVPMIVRKAAQNLKYRGLICVFVAENKRNYTLNHWVYTPDKHIIGRFHEPKNWSRYMAPENKTGICVEIFCNKDCDIWKMTDKEIAHQVIRDLPLRETSKIEGHFVVRVDHAYPIYTLNYRENLKTVKDYLSSYKNLFLLGRTGSFRYIHMDSCIEEGLKLGDFLIKEEMNQQ